MEDDQNLATLEEPPRRRPALLPLLIFVVCGGYFTWRWWETGDLNYALFTGIIAVGLVMTLLASYRFRNR